MVLRAKSEGENPVYYVLGETDAGRHLFCVVIRFPDGKGLPDYRASNDQTREVKIPKMEKPMKKTKLPRTDSVSKLAEFWDTHDLTEFDEELEEVSEPVFARNTRITVVLEPPEAKAIAKLAEDKGVSTEELVLKQANVSRNIAA